VVMFVTIDDKETGGENSCNLQKETEEIQKENDEVLGWTLDASAREVTVMGTAVFVSSDLLRLAKEAAGCLHWKNIRNAPVFGSNKYCNGGRYVERLSDATDRIDN
jgi:hypothetical protein